MDDERNDADAADEQPMIDIHPPEQAAHSWRDIFIHLATITVGLFIALSLEGCVEWQHHRHLVREARENIRTEMQENQKELHDTLGQIHKEQAQVKSEYRGTQNAQQRYRRAWIECDAELRQFCIAGCELEYGA